MTTRSGTCFDPQSARSFQTIDFALPFIHRFVLQQNFACRSLYRQVDQGRHSGRFDCNQSNSSPSRKLTSNFRHVVQFRAKRVGMRELFAQHEPIAVRTVEGAKHAIRKFDECKFVRIQSERQLFQHKRNRTPLFDCDGCVHV
jgi:hypothetical protein